MEIISAVDLLLIMNSFADSRFIVVREAMDGDMG